MNAEPGRLILYRSAVQNCLQAISSSVSIDEFDSLFRTLPSFKKKQHLICRFYNILSEYINQSVYEQVEEHIKEVELQEKFASLEKLILENSSNKEQKCWRPSYDVCNDLRSYRMEEKLRFKKELERIVTAKEDAVSQLKYDITTTENRAKKLEKRMNDAESYLDAINKSIDDFGESGNGNLVARDIAKSV